MVRATRCTPVNAKGRHAQKDRYALPNILEVPKGFVGGAGVCASRRGKPWHLDSGGSRVEGECLTISIVMRVWEKDSNGIHQHDDSGR
ncbi:hypothetical protein GCM10023081_04730 [Arthrobacter ginkgonis]|uniref:Uncharacterized protein n=1 Tax=Arthrobacter ginkgonis TaxID=1630594 RepID=A0ABP7BW48_9MICC